MPVQGLVPSFASFDFPSSENNLWEHISRESQRWGSSFPSLEHIQQLPLSKHSKKPLPDLLRRRLRIWGLEKNQKYHHELFKLDWFLDHQLSLEWWTDVENVHFLESSILPLYCDVFLRECPKSFFSEMIKEHFAHLHRTLVASDKSFDLLYFLGSNPDNNGENFLADSRTCLLSLLQNQVLPQSLSEIVGVLMLAHAALSVLLPDEDYAREALKMASHIVENPVNSDLLNVCFYQAFTGHYGERERSADWVGGGTCFLEGSSSSSSFSCCAVAKMIPTKAKFLRSVHTLRDQIRQSFLGELGVWRSLLLSEEDVQIFDEIVKILWDSNPAAMPSADKFAGGSVPAVSDITKLPKLIAIATSSLGKDFNIDHLMESLSGEHSQQWTSPDERLLTSTNFHDPVDEQVYNDFAKETPRETCEDSEFYSSGSPNSSISLLSSDIASSSSSDWGGGTYNSLFWAIIWGVVVCLVTLLYLVTHKIPIVRIINEFESVDDYDVAMKYIFSPLKETTTAQSPLYTTIEEAQKSFALNKYQDVYSISQSLIQRAAEVVTIASISVFIEFEEKVKGCVQDYIKAEGTPGEQFCKAIFDTYFQVYDCSNGFQTEFLSQAGESIDPNERTSSDFKQQVFFEALSRSGPESRIWELAEKWDLQSRLSDPEVSERGLDEGLAREINDHAFLLAASDTAILSETFDFGDLDFSMIPPPPCEFLAAVTTEDVVNLLPSSSSGSRWLADSSMSITPALKAHSATIGATAALPMPSTPFACPTCGKRFTNTQNMKRHVREIHKSQGRGCCIACGEEFSRADYILKASGHQKRCTKRRNLL